MIAVHSDGSRIGPESLFPQLTTPGKRGETIVLFANGFGSATTPVTNRSATQSGTLAQLPTITIGGTQVNVQFAGLISPGLFQFNLVIPDSAADGDNAISASHNGYTTQPGTLITVQR